MYTQSEILMYTLPKITHRRLTIPHPLVGGVAVAFIGCGPTGAGCWQGFL